MTNVRHIGSYVLSDELWSKLSPGAQAELRDLIETLDLSREAYRTGCVSADYSTLILDDFQKGYITGVDLAFQPLTSHSYLTTMRTGVPKGFRGYQAPEPPPVPHTRRARTRPVTHTPPTVRSRRSPWGRRGRRAR